MLVIRERQLKVMSAGKPRMFSASRGGMWKAARPIYSEETVEMLEVLMKESRLTLMMRQQLRDSLQQGATQLPLLLRSTSVNRSSRRPQSSPSSETDTPSSRGIRSRESIVMSGAYERQKFKPSGSTSESKQAAKEKLQNIMEFGQDRSPAKPPSSGRNSRDRAPAVTKEVSAEETFQQLASEIDARREFLEQMKEMGLDEQYRSIINGEISQRLRELQKIDDNLDTNVTSK